MKLLTSTIRSDVSEIPAPPPCPVMGSTDLMPTAVRGAKAAWRKEYLGVEELGRKLSKKILEGPGPGPPSLPPSSGEAAGIAGETTAGVLLTRISILFVCPAILCTLF